MAAGSERVCHSNDCWLHHVHDWRPELRYLQRDRLRQNQRRFRDMGASPLHQLRARVRPLVPHSVRLQQQNLHLRRLLHVQPEAPGERVHELAAGVRPIRQIYEPSENDWLFSGCPQESLRHGLQEKHGDLRRLDGIRPLLQRDARPAPGLHGVGQDITKDRHGAVHLGSLLRSNLQDESKILARTGRPSTGFET